MTRPLTLALLSALVWGAAVVVLLLLTCLLLLLLLMLWLPQLLPLVFLLLIFPMLIFLMLLLPRLVLLLPLPPLLLLLLRLWLCRCGGSPRPPCKRHVRKHLHSRAARRASLIVAAASQLPPCCRGCPAVAAASFLPPCCVWGVGSCCLCVGGDLLLV